jgi:hypothetical protein
MLTHEDRLAIGQIQMYPGVCPAHMHVQSNFLKDILLFEFVVLNFVFKEFLIFISDLGRGRIP